ncbi:MAG: hypothetical protein OEY01_07670 [Desulfobulbaceae bacterium]|nr:hypothetical protein [Desulfobulbaceae bacterium]HIJ78933.1 hypothetical protein [Deltaproteobacteria bacterium]
MKPLTTILTTATAIGLAAIAFRTVRLITVGLVLGAKAISEATSKAPKRI